MKTIMVTFAGLVMASLAYAGEELSGDAVKQLISGNTAHTYLNGIEFKNHFAADGKLYRQMDGAITEGTWEVKNNGLHCVGGGVQNSCAKIVKNDDGTYDRLNPRTGQAGARWLKIVEGKDF